MKWLRDGYHLPTLTLVSLFGITETYHWRHLSCSSCDHLSAMEPCKATVLRVPLAVLEALQFHGQQQNPPGALGPLQSACPLSAASTCSLTAKT